MRSYCIALGTISGHLWWSMIMWEKGMYACMCNWVTMMYNRKLTEHCKPAIMGKNHLKKKFTVKDVSLLLVSFQFLLLTFERDLPVFLNQRTHGFYTPLNFILTRQTSERWCTSSLLHKAWNLHRTWGGTFQRHREWPLWHSALQESIKILMSLS